MRKERKEYFDLPKMLGKPQIEKLSILQDFSRSKELVLNSGLCDSSATENNPPAVKHNLKA